MDAVGMLRFALADFHPSAPARRWAVANPQCRRGAKSQPQKILIRPTINRDAIMDTLPQIDPPAKSTVLARYFLNSVFIAFFLLPCRERTKCGANSAASDRRAEGCSSGIHPVRSRLNWKPDFCDLRSGRTCSGSVRARTASTNSTTRYGFTSPAQQAGTDPN